ncbi:MAG TPA: MBL fold metallo-hydrolase [Phycisphaerales bacterium]|nr:MBL fold metallo-hydrolase [Phycisphaerales bacterium]HIB50287.1 MBL fold metallo-hydrolase [Phycisphaerales bacterium]HIN83882.1 MBL fold metallo-hydrolase [Phycisphaerales bacterium]HIO20529.1 MBL fold metallo-hydrolase [Phycisphaerales bacterium]HIO52291.1 MBL fold metallo-hydrolase [Phycisphaerales bacterium]
MVHLLEKPAYQVKVDNFSFTFLGTGTSAGVPVLTCDCEVCTSNDPRDSRLRCSVCIRFVDASGQERVVLIDTSPDLRQQALKLKLTRCDAVLFTHNHVDHTFGLDDIRMFNISMQQPIDIYAERHTLDHLHRVFQHVFEAHNNVNDSFVANLIPNELEVQNPIVLHGVTFTPIRLLHGRLPIVGFRIDVPGGPSLAYCTDVSSIPPETWPQLLELDTLVLDMLRFRHHPTHLNLDQAIEIAEQVGAKQTYFTHMTHCVGHEKTDADLPESMHLAYDGLSI